MMRNTSVSGGSASYALAGAKDARLELRTSLEIKEKLREAASGWRGYEFVYFDGCHESSSA